MCQLEALFMHMPHWHNKLQQPNLIRITSTEFHFKHKTTKKTCYCSSSYKNSKWINIEMQGTLWAEMCAREMCHSGESYIKKSPCMLKVLFLFEIDARKGLMTLSEFLNWKSCIQNKVYSRRWGTPSECLYNVVHVCMHVCLAVHVWIGCKVCQHTTAHKVMPELSIPWDKQRRSFGWLRL